MSEDQLKGRRRAPAGPQLPEYLQRPRNRSKSPEPVGKDGRESWMTSLPDDKLRIDPAKLAPRQFQSQKSTFKKEEPGEKSEKDKHKDDEQEEYVRSYNERHRSEALVDIYQREHQTTKKEEKEKDLADKKFDWERDMNQGTKAGSARNTQELFSKYGSISSRFSSSSSSKRFL